jgi:hypothetical protein
MLYRLACRDGKSLAVPSPVSRVCWSRPFGALSFSIFAVASRCVARNRVSTSCYRICYPIAHSETKRDHIKRAGRGAFYADFTGVAALDQMRPNSNFRITKPLLYR